MQQALSKEARLKSDPQTDRHRHHRHRVAETKRQTHICRERENSKMSERQRIIHMWAYMALFPTSNPDPSDIYPLTRTFLLNLPKHSPTESQDLKCQRFMKPLIQSITDVFFKEWHYRTMLCRHRNPELCLFKSLRIFNILIICRNEVKMPLLWKESFPCLSHSISKSLISRKLIKGYIGLWLISRSYCWCLKQAMWVQPFKCRLFHT